MNLDVALLAGGGRGAPVRHFPSDLFPFLIIILLKTQDDQNDDDDRLKSHFSLSIVAQ